MATQRIQKVLASAGYGSRRACEQLVLDGRVTINGHRTTELPVLVDPASDRITVDGRPIRLERHVYYLLHKPRGVFCTQDDPAGRRRAIDLLTGVRERVFPVGRLDAEATGLLLFTNDGDLAQRLTHPRHGVPRTYRAEVAGCPGERTLDQLRRGAWMGEGRASPAEVSIIHRGRERSILEIVYREGRKGLVRTLLARMGHNVRRLHCIAMGKLSIRKLPVGAYRALTSAEVEKLRLSAAGEDARRAGGRAGAAGPGGRNGRPAAKRGQVARADLAAGGEKGRRRAGGDGHRRAGLAPRGPEVQQALAETRGAIERVREPLEGAGQAGAPAEVEGRYIRPAGRRRIILPDGQEAPAARQSHTGRRRKRRRG
jgi:23S rRNA pseudouridine2605 synthase